MPDASTYPEEEYKDLKERSVTIDVWQRKKNDVGSLMAIYEVGKVIQIQVSLFGYRTKQGLTRETPMIRLGSVYKNPRVVTYTVQADEELGFDPLVEQTWDYPQHGFAVLTDKYQRGTPSINSLIVHKRNNLLLRVTGLYDF